MAAHLELFTGLRGFHVYSNTVNWRPYVGQTLTFKREHDNRHDKFAIAGKTMLKGKIGLIIVGHIQESYLVILGMLFKRGRSLKL